MKSVIIGIIIGVLIAYTILLVDGYTSSYKNSAGINVAHVRRRHQGRIPADMI